MATTLPRELTCRFPLRACDDGGFLLPALACEGAMIAIDATHGSCVAVPEKLMLGPNWAPEPGTLSLDSVRDQVLGRPYAIKLSLVRLGEMSGDNYVTYETLRRRAGMQSLSPMWEQQPQCSYLDGIGRRCQLGAGHPKDLEHRYLPVPGAYAPRPRTAPEAVRLCTIVNALSNRWICALPEGHEGHHDWKEGLV